VQWETEPIPLGFVIVLCFFGGATVMGFVDFFAMLRLRKRVKTLQKDLDLYRPAGAIVPATVDDDRAEEGEDRNGHR